jgi:SAM-dependent methyltransferase
MDLDNQQEYWNRIAETKTFTHPVNSSLLDRLVNKNAIIMDYGCGYGRVVSILRDSGYAQVTGYDTSIGLIQRGTKAGIPDLCFIDEPAHLPVQDGTVDCILLFAVLTCIPANEAQTQLINILHTKLNPGGILYLSDYYLQNNTDETGKYEYLNGNIDNYGVFTLTEGATFRHHTKEWIATLLQQFIISEEQDVPVRTMNGHQAQAFQLIAQKQ